MLIFACQFKALLFTVGLNSTSQLERFFETQDPKTFFKATYRICASLDYDGQALFPQFAPTCGCSDNSPQPGEFPEFNVRDARGRAFCYHRALDPRFLVLFQRLRDFLAQQIYKFFSLIYFLLL